ncbi:hypothetical protein BDZ97DRAFT_1701761 [Flammula alnicola]|nr:hypothetical protein BDZ97DRAFT_1701761 [Flammula alnicola]
MSRNEMLKKRMAQFAKLQDTGEGRTVEELKKTKEVLRGQESARFRLFCTTNRMEPQRDLDAFGNSLMRGNLESIIMDHTARLERLMKSGMEFEVALEAVGVELNALRWGPTQVPLYNLLGLFSQIIPGLRRKYISFAEFYIHAKVPVEGRDLSGTTALSHCFSTKPSFDLEYAQLLYDAGGDVNSRNRYGATVAHEIVQVYDVSDPEVVRKATKSLEWFLSHGGNLDIADGDGMSPRAMCNHPSLVPAIPQFKCLAQKEDERRKLKGSSCCSLCGREDKLLSCSKCKRASYCNPQLRACQKLDWPKHKKECKA